MTTKRINYLIIIITTLSLMHRFLNLQLKDPSFIIGFVIAYLAMRKGQTYQSFRKVYNCDTFKIEFKSMWHIWEVILSIEIYFFTYQFNDGILKGLTTNFRDNLIFSSHRDEQYDASYFTVHDEIRGVPTLAQLLTTQ